MKLWSIRRNWRQEVVRPGKSRSLNIVVETCQSVAGPANLCLLRVYGCVCVYKCPS